MTEERPPAQVVFPCWLCGQDVGQIPANLLQARFTPDGVHREYAHQQGDSNCKPPETKA